MRVRLINTDNNECVDLIGKKSELSFDDDGSAEFEDLAFEVVDKDREDEDILTLTSPWHFYKFAVL